MVAFEITSDLVQKLAKNYYENKQKIIIFL